MGKTTYSNSNAVLEEHINITLSNLTGATAVDKNFTFDTGNADIEMKVEAVAFRKNDGSGTESDIELCIFELVAPIVGGTVPLAGVVDSANLDRNSGRELIGLTVLVDAVIDDTDAVRLMRVGGIATKGIVERSDVKGVNYALKRNTVYNFRSTVVDGATGSSDSILIMDLTLLKED